MGHSQTKPVKGMKGLLAFGAVSGGYAVGNPHITKVVGMLEEMKETCKTEIGEAEIGWNKFKVWCSDTNDAKNREIERTSIDLDEAKAGSLAREAAIGEATTQRNKAQQQSATAADDLKAMRGQRDASNAVFAARKNELEQSIGACEQAHQVLSAVPSDSNAATSLLQSGVMDKLAGKKGSSFTAIRELLQMGSEKDAPPQGRKMAVRKYFRLAGKEDADGCR